MLRIDGGIIQLNKSLKINSMIRRSVEFFNLKKRRLCLVVGWVSYQIIYIIVSSLVSAEGSNEWFIENFNYYNNIKLSEWTIIINIE